MKTLEEFYRSEYFQIWDESNRSAGNCGIILSDPERFGRICKAAENGSEGSTHAEIIDDWRNCLRCAVDDEEITETDAEGIEREIEECEKWHEKNGSLNKSLF